MRTVDVRLPEDYLKVLLVYGSLSDVTNKALEQISLGKLPEIAEMPSVGELGGKTCKKLITVNNDDYEMLVNIYGQHSSKVSLKRLLCYIVDTEAYEALGWKPVLPNSTAYKYKLNHCIDILKSIYKIAPLKHISALASIIEQLNTLT